ncbi:MAG: tetratricopeptide repeat protein [Candidatus Gastranaerophilaceae bacterium]
MNVFIQIMKKTVTKMILAVLCLMLLLSVFVFWTWWEKQFKKIPGYYNVYKGDKAYRNANYQKAIDYYKRGLEYYPEHAEARCNLGNLYVVYENFSEAAVNYEEALKYNPDDMECRINYAIILSEELGEHDKALREYTTVIDTKPFVLHLPFIYDNTKSVKINRGTAYYNKGVVYRKKSIYMGDRSLGAFTFLEKAAESYHKAKKILKKDYDTHYNLALTEQLLGNEKTAGLEYCKAIELKPFNFEAHYNLGLLLRSMKLYEESIAEFEKAGMSADLANDGTKQLYLFQIMDDVKQRIIFEGKPEILVNHRSESALDDGEITYKYGKVILLEDSGKILEERMKSCPSKKYFEAL